MKSYLEPEYIVERNDERCIRCKVCVNQCTYETHYYNPEDDKVYSRDENCVNCHRCVVFCPTKAITIKHNPFLRNGRGGWIYYINNDEHLRIFQSDIFDTIRAAIDAAMDAEREEKEAEDA